MILRNALTLAIVILLVAGTSTLVPAQVGPDATEWQTLRPEGEEFSIEIPKDSTAEKR